MALMTDTDRRIAWADFMRSSEVAEVFTLPKHDVRDAIDALDQWFNDNAALLNQALPVSARTALNTQQKARLLTVVIRQRYLSQV